MTRSEEASTYFLSEVLPGVADELRTLLHAEGEHRLAEQIDLLEIIDRCGCGDDFCAMFYTTKRPSGDWGPGHRNVALLPKHGYMTLDVVNDQIAAVELLYRDDVREKLGDLRFPSTQTDVTRG